MNKIRIIHLQVLPIFSGVQKAMYDILVRLDRSKYDITVLCQSEGELTDLLRQAGIRYILLPALHREINPFYDFVAFLKLYKLFKSERYHLVHTHSSKPGFIGRLAARVAGVNCIVHTVQGFAFHEQSSKVTRLVFGFLEKLAGFVTDKTIFVNQQDRSIASQMKLIPAHKMVTIYNGVDLKCYHSEKGSTEIEDSIRFQKNIPMVGMVARLWKQKAPQDYIRAIPTVLQELPDAKFLVIGDGPMQRQLEQMCDELGVKENVTFLGWRKDISAILKMIDVFVLPSLWEGLPLSILEAMASARPVVATNIKGNNELVIDGETGFLVPPSSPERIGKSVLELLKNRTLAKKMGQKACQRVKENFDINDIVGKINFEYETLLEKKSVSLI